VTTSVPTGAAALPIGSGGMLETGTVCEESALCTGTVQPPSASAAVINRVGIVALRLRRAAAFRGVTPLSYTNTRADPVTPGRR
jgi:hypothetical protein